jgi:hypothetical protein
MFTLIKPGTSNPARFSEVPRIILYDPISKYLLKVNFILNIYFWLGSNIKLIYIISSFGITLKKT